MKRLLVSEPAAQDLDEIWYYVDTTSGSIVTADRVVDTITDSFPLLTRHPRAGMSRDGIEAGLRGFPAGSYIIYYREEGPAVFIKRILHGMREQRTAYLYSSPPPR